MTFDDGPYIYTSGVLDLFDKYNAKGTFFMTANNIGKGPIDDASYPWRSLIQRMDAAGHQIASHTWSHQDLSAITSAQLQDQIYHFEMASRNILGKFPTYMRPPYSSCNADCQTFLASAGYHIIYFDQDTSDYLFITPDLIQISKDYVTGNLTLKGNPVTDDWLTISHDIHPQTAQNLTEFMLQAYTAKGFKLVTVGECLGDPVANWYRAADGAGTYASKSATPSPSASNTGSVALPSPTGISSDASCGSNGGATCLNSVFGNCCSAAGWCGATDVYCGSGCQVGYGNCGSNIVSGASAASSSVGPLQSLVPTVDSSCGGTTGYTCLGFVSGTCCSVNGWW
jgi:peptidoglycan/xylan/chitin deacetylase (PgdA/CDA1 family)